MAEDPRTHSFRQWPGVRRPAIAGVVEQTGDRDPDIEPGSPWENGYCESFNGKLRDECWNGEIFYSLKEAQVVIEQWRQEYNTRRPHSALGYRPPAPGPIASPRASMVASSSSPLTSPEYKPWLRSAS